jgi:predicted esterase
VRLPVARFHPAVVSLPVGTGRSFPLLVATHGAGGRPEPHCELWRRITAARGFVLCPAGARASALVPERESGYFYPGHPALAAELEAAIAALVQRYGERVDSGQPVYAGYSQGATMGALVLPTHPAAFARAALVEGGVGESQEWNIATARRFAERGGRRLLLACGRPACASAAATTVAHLGRGGIEARLVHVAGAGHTYLGGMEQALHESFGWLVAGDDRW